MSNPMNVLEDARKPLRVAGREAYVFPRYLDRMHEHTNTGALVTHNGTVIERCGIKLRLDMVPMERRFAIGKVDGFTAEVLPQHVFAEEAKLNYIEEYQMRGKSPDNVTLMYIPSVVDFVAKKIDPTDPKRLVDLGFDPERKAEPAKKEDALVEVATLRAQKDAQALQIDDLQRKIDELAHLMATKPEPAPSIRVAEKETAPCGREVTKGYVEQHVARCKKPECNP